MPTIFSHAIFATVLGKAGLKNPVSYWFWFLTAVCAIIPDADVITRSFGAERGTMLAHRGITHSIFFALFFGSLVAFFAHKFLKTGISLPKLIAFFSLATVSHPLLDMLTNGGSGAAIFAPFSNERFFFPWRPVKVSPIGLDFFGSRGFDVIISEIIWLWIPAFVVMLLAITFRKLRKKESQ